MKASQLKPTDDRVVIRPEEAITKTASGIIIPDTAKEKPKKGEVLAIGDEVENLKVGDIVLYGKFAGSEIDCKDDQNAKDTVLIMRRTDVLSVITQ